MNLGYPGFCTPHFGVGIEPALSAVRWCKGAQPATPHRGRRGRALSSSLVLSPPADHPPALELEELEGWCAEPREIGSAFAHYYAPRFCSQLPAPPALASSAHSHLRGWRSWRAPGLELEELELEELEEGARAGAGGAGGGAAPGEEGADPPAGGRAGAGALQFASLHFTGAPDIPAPLAARDIELEEGAILSHSEPF